MSLLNKIQILLRTHQCFCTSITWKNEVYGDFLTLKIKAGHGQGHLVILTIQYDILMLAKRYFFLGKSLIWQIKSNNQVICSHSQQFYFWWLIKWKYMILAFLEWLYERFLFCWTDQTKKKKKPFKSSK